MAGRSREAVAAKLQAGRMNLEGGDDVPQAPSMVEGPAVPADRLWLHRMAMQHGLWIDRLKPKSEVATGPRTAAGQSAPQPALLLELKGGYSDMHAYLKTVSGSSWGLKQMHVRAGAGQQHQLSLWLEPLSPLTGPPPQTTVGHGPVIAHDPFAAVVLQPPAQIVALAPSPRSAPDAMPEHWQAELRRVRQPLEAHALKELFLTGTLRQGQAWFALVRAGAVVHALGVNDYVGLDLGRVRAIDEEGLDLREIRRDESGRWAEHLLRWRVGASP
ncbi:MAG: pilus assembly protein PilP [Comamonadaceae bacterium]|nr:pilus assembly protein PilP [Comamonadaceae bacterium]